LKNTTVYFDTGAKKELHGLERIPNLVHTKAQRHKDEERKFGLPLPLLAFVPLCEKFPKKSI
jgi:hypothetical protein